MKIEVINEICNVKCRRKLAKSGINETKKHRKSASEAARKLENVKKGEENGEETETRSESWRRRRKLNGSGEENSLKEAPAQYQPKNQSMAIMKCRRKWKYESWNRKWKYRSAALMKKMSIETKIIKWNMKERKKAESRERNDIKWRESRKSAAEENEEK